MVTSLAFISMIFLLISIFFFHANVTTQKKTRPSILGTFIVVVLIFMLLPITTITKVFCTIAIILQVFVLVVKFKK